MAQLHILSKGTSRRMSIKLKEIPKIEELQGSTKHEIFCLWGHGYNDVHSDTWMYRLERKGGFFKQKYLYLFFENNKVKQLKLSRIKKSL